MTKSFAHMYHRSWWEKWSLAKRISVARSIWNGCQHLNDYFENHSWVTFYWGGALQRLMELKLSKPACLILFFPSKCNSKLIFSHTWEGRSFFFDNMILILLIYLDSVTQLPSLHCAHLWEEQYLFLSQLLHPFTHQILSIQLFLMFLILLAILYPFILS